MSKDLFFDLSDKCLVTQHRWIMASVFCFVMRREPLFQPRHGAGLTNAFRGAEPGSQYEIASCGRFHTKLFRLMRSNDQDTVIKRSELMIHL